MTYRDTFAKCPRCGVDLVDARDARGCRTCGGLWLQEAVFHEMVTVMLPPRPLSRLALAVIDRRGEPIACPECGTTMDQVGIQEVVVDRCTKQHGLWFDKKELELALRRIADPKVPPPLEEIDPAFVRPSPPRPVVGSGDTLVFKNVVTGVQHDLRQQIIKVGKLASAHLRIVDDDSVSRMHAVIEVHEGEINLIDLGSSIGSYVNGHKVSKMKLGHGDRLRFGRTEFELSVYAVPSQ